MNKERILTLADTIEKLKHRHVSDASGDKLQHFNMAVWKCGTAGCIGGWTLTLWPTGNGDIHTEFIAEALDINFEDAAQITQPSIDVICEAGGLPAPETHAFFGVYWKRIKPASAVHVLRHYAETGEVDWFTAIRTHGLLEEV